MLACTSSYEVEDLVEAVFYCRHAFADGNYCIQIPHKTKILHFLMKLPTPFACCFWWLFNWI